MSKIIFVHLLNDFSGSPKVLSQVIKAAKSKDLDVALLTGNKGEGFLTKLVKEHDSFGYARSANKFRTLHALLYSQYLLFFKLWAYRKQDVVIYVNTMLPFGAGIAGWLIRKPVIYHVHEISLSPPALKRFLRWVIQRTATKVIFVSEAVKASESFRDKPQQVVYNALPQKFMEKAMLARPSERSLPFTVLLVASLKAYKGIYEFLALAQKLKNEKGYRFNLVLNAGQEEIDHFFRGMALPATLTINTRQSNVIPFYQEADVLLNLSRPDEWVETFGLTILEAMAFGLPVIVPPVGGPVEIVANGVEGYHISCYETERLVAVIKELSQHTALYETLSHNAKQRAATFNEATFYKSITSILHV